MLTKENGSITNTLAFATLQDHSVLMSLGQEDASLASTTLKVCSRSSLQGEPWAYRPLNSTLLISLG